MQDGSPEGSGGDDLELDVRVDVLVQAHGGLVGADGADLLADLDLALVDLAQAGGLDGVGDLLGLDRAEQTALGAGLGRDRDGGRGQRGRQGLRVLERGELTGRTSGLDGLDLALGALGPLGRKAAGKR